MATWCDLTFSHSSCTLVFICLVMSYHLNMAEANLIDESMEDEEWNQSMIEAEERISKEVQIQSLTEQITCLRKQLAEEGRSYRCKLEMSQKDRELLIQKRKRKIHETTGVDKAETLYK